eukprot:1138771-Rhodomonas_salina.2
MSVHPSSVMICREREREGERGREREGGGEGEGGREGGRESYFRSVTSRYFRSASFTASANGGSVWLCVYVSVRLCVRRGRLWRVSVAVALHD